jgi:hypothetical protein
MDGGLPLRRWTVLYQRRNFSGLDRLPQFEDGDIFEWCNFSQAEPHTRIGEGATGLTFTHCNLNNCDVPPDADVRDSLVVHRAWIPVATISNEEYLKRQAEEEAAYRKAEEDALKAPITATVDSTYADVVASMEATKSENVDLAMAALNAERESKSEPILTGLTPRQNEDGTWTYSRLEVVK